MSGSLLNDTFCFTYGDGLADVDVGALLASHRASGLAATVTAVRPTGRFGALELDPAAGRVEEFREKTEVKESWVNGCFFVLEPSVLPLIAGDGCSWENEVLPELARRRQLNAYCQRFQHIHLQGLDLGAGGRAQEAVRLA